MAQPDKEWTKILGWPGYRVYKHEINEKAKTLKLWVRRKSGHQKLVCGGCGQRVDDIRDIYEREVRDLPWGEYRVTVVIELYRVNCPRCGVKAEKVELLPSKAPFSKRFEEAVAELPRFLEPDTAFSTTYVFFVTTFHPVPGFDRFHNLRR
jgi:transposase